MNNKKNKAFLKWAGGKFSLVEKIKQQLPEADKLIEPFVGAGSVFLNTDYRRYLLNDINPDLISLYQLLAKHPKALIDETKQLFCPENNRESRYYELRERFNTSGDPWERAILFVYLNRHGYNGLCRYSSTGRFNVPFGRYKRPYFPEEEMWYFSEKSRRATFTCSSFSESFKRAKLGNVIYCDPPYIPISTSSSFTAYARNGFNFEEQQKLARIAKRTSTKKNIPVLISNHDLPETRALYEGALFTCLKVKRSISQNPENRKPVREILALFYNDKNK